VAVFLDKKGTSDVKSFFNNSPSCRRSLRAHIRQRDWPEGLKYRRGCIGKRDAVGPGCQEFGSSRAGSKFDSNLTRLFSLIRGAHSLKFEYVQFPFLTCYKTSILLAISIVCLWTYVQPLRQVERLSNLYHEFPPPSSYPLNIYSPLVRLSPCEEVVETWCLLLPRYCASSCRVSFEHPEALC
jgi:hypothetical protein